MAYTASARIVKEFTYRGAVRRFSNRYHIGVNSPPDAAHWETLLDNIVAAEKLIYVAFAAHGARIVEGIGYNPPTAPDQDMPFYSKTYNVDGVASQSGNNSVPGDCAALIRYTTPDRSTKNHPVYCFNYYHAMRAPNETGDGDVIHSGQLTLLNAYATAWMTGFSDGVTTFHRSRPTGSLVTGFSIPTTFTHRDLRH